MPDSEHEVQQHGTKDIEADVGPADTKVAPTLAVVYDYSSQQEEYIKILENNG